MKSRTSPRRSDYDYTSAGGYFITICTAGRQHYFGEVVDGEMILNELGKICQQQILQLEKTRSYVEIHEQIIMPNHVHMLILLNDMRRGGSVTHPITDDIEGGLPQLWLTQSVLIRPYEGPSLSSIIQSLKANITKEIAKQGIIIPFDDLFGWQRSFHDHIIRNQQSYEQIKHYITTNPQNRESDTFNQ